MTTKVNIPFNALEFVLPDKKNKRLGERMLTDKECELLKTHPYTLKAVGFYIYADYEQVAHLHSLMASKYRRATTVWAPKQENYDEINDYLKTLTREKTYVLEPCSTNQPADTIVDCMYFILRDIQPVYLNNGKYEVVEMEDDAERELA